jgi:uncharacterized membrane protein YhaH (DUF805 family)
MNWYFDVIKKYAQFEGRARRKEYWYFTLFNLIVVMVLFFFDYSIGVSSLEWGFGILSGIYSLAMMIPSIAVAVRRLHDTDRTGWWFLLFIVPYIGGIAMIIMLTRVGTSGINQYGEDPI